MDLHSTLISLIPVLVPLLIALLKGWAPKIPKRLLPIIAPLLGGVADAAIAWASGGTPNPLLGAALGSAGVGLREVVDQMRGQGSGAGGQGPGVRSLTPDPRPQAPKGPSSNLLASCLLLFALCALLPACATTDVLTGQALTPEVGKDDIDPLTQLANNGLIAAVLDDAAETERWVMAQANLDPVRQELALACPRAARFAATDFHDKVLALKALVDQVGTGLYMVNLQQPRLMLRLTQLKYGNEPDLEERIATLRADVALRLDALFTGCAHLFPKRQVLDLAKLAGKAGLLSTGAGGLAGMLLP